MVRLVPGFWVEHACRVAVERPIVRAERSGMGNNGSDRSDTISDGDSADANQHGDGHAGPDRDATGGVGAGPVLDAGAGETLPGAGQDAPDADAVPELLWSRGAGEVVPVGDCGRCAGRKDGDEVTTILCGTHGAKIEVEPDGTGGVVLRFVGADHYTGTRCYHVTEAEREELAKALAATVDGGEGER